MQADDAKKHPIQMANSMNIPQAPCLSAFLLSTALPLPETESARDIQSWQILAQRLHQHWPEPFARAVTGGFCSLNLATAFASGYQSALQALVPGAVDYNATSFCVTEAGGNKPSAITTRLTACAEGWSLNGQKSFVSGADHARQLLVAASTGQDDQGRNQLVMVRVDARQPGVQISNLPPLPFAPEISHGTVRFEQVAIQPDQILPGDGYSAYIKPFRTVEDIHVSSAALGFCIRIARENHLPHNLLEELLALVNLHQSLAGQDPSSAATHLALAGTRHLLDRVLEPFEAALSAANNAAAQHWARDKLLLNVAAKARQQRTAKAWETMVAR